MPTGRLCSGAATSRTAARGRKESRASVAKIGFEVLGVSDCVIHGPKGNREAFLHARNASLREPYSG